MTRSEIMSRIRSVSKMETDLGPEIRRRLRGMWVGIAPRLIHQPRGLRWYGSPDYASKSRKVMVFVHGSFWHGYGYPSRFRLPKANRAFWKAKIERNRARHRTVVRRARRDGWTVLTWWDFQLRGGGL